MEIDQHTTPPSSSPLPSVSEKMPSGVALEDAIIELKTSLNAVILAHYYQDDDIQDIADFVGDSLDLARKAAATDADVIVFCGVRFMAEGAKILSPDKLVLLPDLEAGCSLEYSCQPDKLAEFKAKHPDHIVVSYINCSAGVKALSDIIVTSSNAEHIVNQLPQDQKIIFAPDKYLGAYINKKTGRDMLLWDGSCMVHERFSEEELVKLIERHGDAEVIAHPECPENLLEYAAHIGSTSSLIHYAKQKPGGQYIVLTEPGIFHAMQKESPGSEFIPVPALEAGGGCIACNNCPYMKLNTMEKIYLAMKNKSPDITVEAKLAEQALKPLQRMLEMSQ